MLVGHATTCSKHYKPMNNNDIKNCNNNNKNIYMNNDNNYNNDNNNNINIHNKCDFETAASSGGFKPG